MSEQMAIAIVALLLGWFVGIFPILLAKLLGMHPFNEKTEKTDDRHY